MPLPTQPIDKLRLIQDHIHSLSNVTQSAISKVNDGFDNDAMIAKQALIDVAQRIKDIATALPNYAP